MYIYIFLSVHVCSVISDSLQPHELALTRFLCPWNFPGKNTGVGCYFLLQSLNLYIYLYLSICV